MSPHLDHHHHHAAGERAGGGPVVLDIGDDRGALLVYLDRARIGTELHIRPVDDPAAATHTGVWERHLGGHHVVAAVFPSLTAGTYAVVGDDGGEWCTTDVSPGVVTEMDLTEMTHSFHVA